MMLFQDNKWEIPHFEKMLYDNGLILELLSNIYSITKDKKYQHIIDDTFEWIVNDMTRFATRSQIKRIKII